MTTIAAAPANYHPMTEATTADEAVIFLHVPKTAGTTLNRLIEWEYPLFQMYSVDPVFFRWSAAHLRKLSKERLRKIRVFKGHMLFGLHEVLPNLRRISRCYAIRSSGPSRPITSCEATSCIRCGPLATNTSRSTSKVLPNGKAHS